MSDMISIIVPVYNVEAYLRQCIDSLLLQTYPNLDIILVDDGSTDSSPDICDEYASAHDNITVIHKQNGGLSDARNAGIEVAQGKYIGFVDADDWIAPDMYEYLFNGIEEYNADIALCEYYNVWDKKAQATYRPETRVFTGKGCLRALLQLKIGNYAWNKLYRRELWSSGVRFPKGLKYEDVRTMYRLFDNVSTLVALPEAKYFYRRRSTSITGIKTVGNEAQCVESRMGRFDAIGEQWPDLQFELLKEIYNYTTELRKVVVSSSTDDFIKNIEPMTTVSDFLARHEGDFVSKLGWGRAGRLTFHLLTKPVRASWVRSAKVWDLYGSLVSAKSSPLAKRLRSRMHERARRSLVDQYCELDVSAEIDDRCAFMESRGGEDLAGNMFFLAQGLCARGYDVYLSVKAEHLDKVRTIVGQGSFDRLRIVEKNSLEYFKAFSKSKYIFNDMVFQDMLSKRDGQVWVNTWHGTPLKLLELDIANQRHDLGGATRAMPMYDYLAVPSEYLAEKLLKPAHADQLYKGSILYSGYPRNSVFFDAGQRISLRKDLGIADGMEMFVYMPTWRGVLSNRVETFGQYATQQILDFFEKTLSDNQIIYVKMHNYSNGTLNFDGYVKVRPFPTEYDTYAVLNCADCLISDYSSVFFDYANTRGKIILFTFDKEDYLRNRGLYLDLDSLPFPKVSSYDELACELNLVKGYDDSEFLERFCTYDGPRAADMILDCVLDGKVTCPVRAASSNGKKNILLYDAEYYLRDAITDEIVDEIERLDFDKANYYYGIRQWALKSTPKYLANLPDGMRLYPLTLKPTMSSDEKRAAKAGALPASYVSREMRREFYGMPFDEIRILHANDFDPFVPLLRSLGGVEVRC